METFAESNSRYHGMRVWLDRTIWDMLWVDRMDEIFLHPRINVVSRTVPPISKYKILLD